MPPFNCISALGYTQEVNRLLTTGNNPDGEVDEFDLFCSSDYTQEVDRLLTGINPNDEVDQVSLFCSTFRERLGLWRCAFIGGDENSLKGDNFKGVREREDCRCSMGGREVVVVIVSRV